jgi:hypothetical protein
VKSRYTFVRRGAGTRHIVDVNRHTHTVCGLSLESPKKTSPYDSGHPWREVDKGSTAKLCGSCDRMKDAETMRGRA